MLLRPSNLQRETNKTSRVVLSCDVRLWKLPAPHVGAADFRKKGRRLRRVCSNEKFTEWLMFIHFLMLASLVVLNYYVFE